MRSISLAVAATALAFIAVGTALAKDPPRAQGKPKDYKAGETVRYAVWHDDDGWHLRCTTAKKHHHFKGVVTIKGGEFENVKLVKAEVKDRFRLGPKKHVIEFDFSTDEGEDGFDFHASKGAEGIDWDCEVGPGNDKAETKKNPDLIYIGEDGDHPEKVPFHTFAHPVKQHNKKEK